MSPANTIWRDAPAFFDYIARTQSFLQSGKPDNDFLLYFPIYDIWHEKRGNYYLPFAIHDVLHELPRFAESVETILNSGFDADYISDRFLQTCSVENGLLKTGGGSIYKALILPSVKRIPLETISKIYELAKQGATIIFSGQYPEDVPGLFRLEERRKSFEKIMKHLRTEKTVVTPNIETWPAAFLQPFESEEFITKYNGKLIRRKTDEGHIYFFTMLKNNPVNNWVTLGVNAKSAIFFDPMTGKNGKAKIRQDSGKSEVFMQLKPGQSIILKTFTDKNIDLENWKYFEATGKTFDLNENWNLKFIESEPAVKQTFQLKKTGSWTDLPNDTLKVNMATARYSKSFSFKKEAGKEYLLSLGDVRESAVVRINGKKVATLFAVPFETLIGEYLKDGENLLEIDVTNLPANRIADYDRRGVEWRIFHEINFVDIQYKGTKYDKWEVMPSGLLGEVKIEELSGEQFPLIEKGKPVCIYLSDDQSNVINSAFEMFSEDLAKVSGNKPLKISDLQNNSVIVIHLKTAGNFDKEILKNVDLSEIQNHWEAFSIQQIKYNNKNLLLVAGSDARGTAYGILELSRMIGVSPWVWWADCVPREKTDLYLPENYRNTQKPSVQYRGIFINDEDWGLLPWATKTFDKTAKKGEISPKVYEKVFQLLLRLRANTILPAMHECTVPFYKVEGNAQMADKYGIIVSTSHCEPMLCNIAGEWDKATFGEYNYLINKNFILNYWKKRITETKNYENIYTLGMRGVHDGKMEGVKTLDEQTFVLQQVINDQRQLLQQNLNPNVEQLPQQFVPYKEVLEVYENGLQLPDDVTLTWCDDNYGYIIRLSNENEKKRSGGAGLYYHVSYWGRPHDYLWLCTTPPALLAWQMRKAFDNGARRLWVLNVGDIKPAEYQTELFLDMAWNIESVDVSNVYKHKENFYQREFGADS